MTTSLSSLRVDASLDASGYVSGMSAKISADQAGTASATALANSITTTQTSFNGSGTSVDSLSKRFINGYSAAESFQKSVLALGAATDRGAVSFQQQVDLLSGISSKYGLLADSGALAAKSFGSLSGAAQVVNDRFASQAVAATGAASKFELVGAELVRTSSASSGTANALATMNNQFLALATGLGPTGVILAGFGPAGLAVAAAIGLASSAFESLVAGADDLAAKSTALQTFATATGLTTDEIQGLSAAGAAMGVSNQTVARSVEEFATAVGQAQQGTGTLFTSLLKVNPQLALQVSGAHDVATAFNLIATAYQNAANAGNSAGAANIGRAAFGRGGAAAAPALLGSTANAGGISQLGTNAAAAGDTIESSLIPRLTALNAQLEQTKTNATNAFESMFAEQTLSDELAFYSGLDKIVGVLTRLQGLMSDMPSATKGMGAALLSVLGVAGAIPAALLSMNKPSAPAPATAPANDNGLGMSVAGLAGLGRGEASLTATSAALYAVQQKLISALAGTATPAQQLNLQILGLSKSVEEHTLDATQAAHAQSLLVEAFNVTQLQSNISAMGALATPTQQYTLAVAKLKEELDESKISQGSFNIGVLAAQQAMNSSTESIKEQFGIASDADIATAAFTKYNNAMAAIGATAQQSAAGLPALNKQIQATIDSVHGAASATPQFTQMILDLQNANKTKDELLTSSGNALLQAAPAFVQALQQGQTIAQAIATSLTGAANAIANAFATAGAKQIAGLLLGAGSSSATNKGDVSECSESDEVFRQDSDDQRYGHLSGRRNGRALGQQGSGVLENSSHRGNVRQLSAWRRDQKRAA